MYQAKPVPNKPWVAAAETSPNVGSNVGHTAAKMKSRIRDKVSGIQVLKYSSTGTGDRYRYR